ncbi:MAG: hypothetical protein WC178_02750 [Candidatus Paceibacterota bacterium]
MKRRKIWYQRHLFKNHFKSYKDWDHFNPASDFKYPMRYRSDALICRNDNCPREQVPISEHEAYYYFAKHHFLGRIKLKICYIFKFGRKWRQQGGCYVCPFCGEGGVEEFKGRIFLVDPRNRVRRKGKKP